MQTLRLKTGFDLAVNKRVIRFASVNTASVNDNVEISQNKNLKSWREIPGPPSLPLIGPLLNFLPGGEFSGLKGVFLADAVYKKYGPISRLDGMFGSTPIVWLFDADAAEHVLRSENTMPIRPGFTSLEYYRKHHKKTYDPSQQTGLLSDHGPNWKEFRSKVGPIMLQPKTIKLYSDVLAEVAEDMVARMRLIRDKDNKITKRLDVEMNLWALESVGVVPLGTRLNCFDLNLPNDSAARKLIQNVHDLFIMFEKIDFGPSPWRYFSTPNFRKAMKIYEEQERQGIKNMEESKKNGTYNSDSEKPILEKLLEIDVKVANIMASDMLVAGVDTAANTALATLYLLSKNPEKQSKLREKVLAKKGQRSYVRACIKESMRMMPVTSGNIRKSTKEYDLMGYKIPKDLYIVFGHQTMSNLEQHYPRPNEFIPERWIVDKTDPLHHGNAHPFANNGPFGYGVRMCIGRRIAELEMETFVSKVVENFTIGWDGPPPTIKPIALNYVTEPYNFTFKDL